jgi:hypothetical protein
MKETLASDAEYQQKLSAKAHCTVQNNAFYRGRIIHLYYNPGHAYKGEHMIFSFIGSVGLHRFCS